MLEWKKPMTRSPHPQGVKSTPAKQTTPVRNLSKKSDLIRMNTPIFSSAKSRKIESRLFIEKPCSLGEGPFWHENKLWWVDIEAGELLSADDSGASRLVHAFGQRLGAVAPMGTGRFVVALEKTLGIFDSSSGNVHPVASPDKGISGNRCNDGKCDLSGRFVVGTLNMNGQQNAAALYSIGTDGKLKKILSPTTISNGLAWSADGKTLYFVDSPTYQIVAFDYDAATGQLENRTVVVRVPKEAGLPDGMDIDTEGNLWVGHWGGGAVRCWSPATGECLAEVPVPCPHPTSCCFGGPNFDRIYITTARMPIQNHELFSFPLAGSVFVCDPEAQGRPPNLYRGPAL
jgi:sugar lactone lactonase YvrE